MCIVRVVIIVGENTLYSSVVRCTRISFYSAFIINLIRLYSKISTSKESGNTALFAHHSVAANECPLKNRRQHANITKHLYESPSKLKLFFILFKNLYCS